MENLNERLESLKCNKIKVLDTVIHDGKQKTVISICLGWATLVESTVEEVLNDKKNIVYGDWIDLDEITLMNK